MRNGPEPESLKARTRRAGFWTLGGQAVRAVLQITSVIILARLLTPEDFGLFGMVMAYAALAELTRDLGLGGAAVQAETVTPGQRSNLWWINVAAGTLAATVANVLSPLAVMMFREPRLPAYIAAVSVTFVLNGAAAQFSASLDRDLRFRETQITSVISQAMGLVVCVMGALASWGTWALIAQSVATAVLWCLVVTRLAGWRPQRWDKDAPMRDFLGFGINLFAFQLVTYAGNYVVSIVMGRNFGARELGAYTRGAQLVTTPIGYVAAPVSTVAFPALSRVQDQPAKQAHYALVVQQTLGYVVAILCMGLLVEAPVFVPFILGDGWGRTVVFVELLALQSVLGFVPLAAGWLLQSQGRTDMQFRLGLFWSIVRVAAVVAASAHSVEALLWATVVVSALSWPSSYYLLGRTTQVPVGALIVGVLRVFAVTGTPAAVCVALREGWARGLQPLSQFALLGGLYCALVALALLIPTVRRDVSQGWAVLRGR